MASERGSIIRNIKDTFEVSGPQPHLTSIDWNDEDHRRSVAACLVQGVYVMKRDRNLSRLGNEALAPPWWESFQFELVEKLIDDNNADSSIFGAIFELKSSSSSSSSSHNSTINEKSPPCYVIAFRGTQLKTKDFLTDIKLDISIIRNTLHKKDRFKKAEQAVDSMLSRSSNIWLTGHSLGAALAMLVGKKFAKNNILLETFLFNPPFTAAPMSGFRFGKSLFTAGFNFATSNNKSESESMFVNLAKWYPLLHVNQSDPICCVYITYFAYRKKMEDKEFAITEKLFPSLHVNQSDPTKHSIRNLVLNEMSKYSLIEEPLHYLPSANLVVNLSPKNAHRIRRWLQSDLISRAKNKKNAHGLRQWWESDLQVKSYKY